jgi:hypothetical protein
MSIATILGIVSGVLGLLKWFVSYTEQKKWMEAGAAQAILKGIEDADQIVKQAREARQAVRDQHMRDPDSVMRDDEFKRPD